ncbi:hypothetical protein MANI_029066 [Metarhizium anisopliae]|nr:hypothetical protein MANI_029066 [Metarhizium anisopliae]
MSDEELDQYIGRLDWVSNRIYCEGAAGIAARRLRHQQRMIDINEIINTVEEVHLCGSTDNPNPGPPPTGDQAAHPGPSTRGDCERKSAEIIKGLTPDPDPARWEEVAWQDREASTQKRPVPEVVAQAQQAICSPSASDRAPESSSDEPPPKKSKDATERSGVYEFFSDFPWDILDDQGQDEAALPAEPEQQQPGQEPEQQQPGQEPQQDQDQDEQLGVQQWPDFLNQVWQHFRVDERRLVAYLDRNDGLSSLQQEHAPIYSLLQQTFPSLLGVLRQIAEAGLTFGSCLPGPPSSPKARANQGKKDELCAKVLAAIGRSTKAPGSQQKENDKTPSTSPSTPPSAPQDNTSPSVLKTIAAIGIPLAGAGLGAFAASAAGEGLLASTAASFGIGAAVGTAEGVEGAVSTVAYSMPRTIT